jgi:hypothetical protein
MNTRSSCEKDILALRLLKDNWRTGARRLKYDVTCVGSCYSYIVYLLIQPNCTELQPSMNILIWVEWLFDHSVYYVAKLLLTIGEDGTVYYQDSF